MMAMQGQVEGEESGRQGWDHKGNGAEDLSQQLVFSFQGFQQPEEEQPKPQPFILSGFLSEDQPHWPFLVSDASKLVVLPQPSPVPDSPLQQPPPQGSDEAVSAQDPEAQEPAPRPPSPESTCQGCCQNEYCGAKEGLKRYREAKQRLLCKGCFECLKAGYYCDFCSQIYSPNNDCVDGKEWVKCDYCERWNHTDCQKARRGLSVGSGCYQCLRCAQSRRRPAKRYARVALDTNFQYQDVVKKRKCTESRARLGLDKPSIPIFTRGRPKEQNYGVLDSFLIVAGCKAHASEDNVRQDLMRLGRLMACLREQSSSGGSVDENKGKGGKQKKGRR